MTTWIIVLSYFAISTVAARKTFRHRYVSGDSFDRDNPGIFVIEAVAVALFWPLALLCYAIYYAFLRSGKAEYHKIKAAEAKQQESLAFWRDKLHTGNAAEQAAARDYLDSH